MGFERRIGIIGHPTTPEVAWSDEQLIALKDAGFRALSLGSFERRDPVASSFVDHPDQRLCMVRLLRRF